MARPTMELQRKAPQAPTPAPASAEVAAEIAPAAVAVTSASAPSKVAPITLLGEIEAALAGTTDARVHAALATLATLLHEMRIKFGAAEHLIADDLRAKIKSIL